MLTYNYGRNLNDLVIENHGKTLYLLGTAGIGPVNEPIKITSIEHSYNVFGDKGTIPNAIEQLSSINHSCEIIACKVSGLHSMLHLNVNIIKDDIVEDGVVFMSTGANKIYNKIEFTFIIDRLEIKYPAELGGHLMTYSYSDYPIIGLLSRRINFDAEEGFGHVFMSSTMPPSTPTYGAFVGVNSQYSEMYGGEDGLNITKECLYYHLQDTYNLLESHYIDIIVPLGAYIDDVHPRVYYGEDMYNSVVAYSADRQYLDMMIENEPATFHRQLINFCKKQMKFGMITHGVIGMNPIKDVEALKDPKLNYLVKLIQSSVIGHRVGFQKVDENKPNADDSRYISIVCGDIRFNSGIIDNGYIIYSALLASTDAKLSTTNIPVNGTMELVHEFSNEELSFLADSSVTSFRISPLKGLVVSSGVTAATLKSEYHYVCNIRMVQLVLSNIYRTLGTYIGESVTKLKNNKIIENSVELILDKLKKDGVIKEENHIVNYDTIKGYIRIDISLKTLYMVESVNASAGGGL